MVEINSLTYYQTYAYFSLSLKAFRICLECQRFAPWKPPQELKLGSKGIFKHSNQPKKHSCTASAWCSLLLVRAWKINSFVLFPHWKWSGSVTGGNLLNINISWEMKVLSFCLARLRHGGSILSPEEYYGWISITHRPKRGALCFIRKAGCLLGPSGSQICV